MEEKKKIIKKEELQEETNKLEKVNTKQYFSIPIEVLERNSSQACICYMYLLYKSNLGNIVTNTTLAKDMKCSTRTISRLIDELEQNNCIKILYVNKTIRYIYPVYILPIIYKINNTEIEEIKENKEIENNNKLEQIKKYIEKYSKEKYNSKPIIEAEELYNYYESKDWYSGKSKITNIEALIRLWIDKKVKQEPNILKEINEDDNGGFRRLEDEWELKEL